MTVIWYLWTAKEQFCHQGGISAAFVMLNYSVGSCVNVSPRAFVEYGQFLLTVNIY